MVEVKLFGNMASPFSNRIEIALKMKGVEYEFISEDLGNKSELLLKYNPIHKKVPVMLHNGKPICESHLILEYIDETWKENPILPQDTYERSQARFWAKFIDEKCMPTIWKACWSRDKEQGKGIEEAIELLKTVETQLKDKKFFGGDKIGFLDIVANCIGFWVGILLEVNEIEFLTHENFPLLYKWIDEYTNVPVIMNTLPQREIVLGFFKAFPQPPTGPIYK